jgi:hypothetical protein
VRSLSRLGPALRPGQLNRPGTEQVLASEAGVPLASVRVQDPEGRPPARWSGPVASDDHLRVLANHVPAEPDPRSTGQLEPDAGRLADGAGERRSRVRTRRLEHDDGDSRPSRQRRQATEPIGEGPSRTRAGALRVSAPRVTARGTPRQVDDQQVDRSTGQERAGDRQALVGIGGRQDDEPLGLDPPGHHLDRVQRSRQVQPGNDRALGLGCRGEPQGEGRPAARRVAPECHAHAPWHAAGAEDGVEVGEARGEDPIRVGLRQRARLGCFERNRGQGPDDVTRVPGRSRAPARSEGGEGGVQVRVLVRVESGHRPLSIEQTFE